MDFLYKPIDPQMLVCKAHVFFELHRQKQALAQELQERTEALQINEMFMAVLSHDLRTPLMSIMAAAEVLRRPLPPDRVAAAVVPDLALGPHVAPLGLASSVGSRLPRPFTTGMFIGQHGSWNRRPHSGYKVIFVPFQGNQPAGQPVDVLTGFLSEQGEALGRPVGVAVDTRGALLVADDVGNVIWRVSLKP